MQKLDTSANVQNGMGAFLRWIRGTDGKPDQPERQEPTTDERIAKQEKILKRISERSAKM